ncbi:MAG TPA: hypothetical protein VFU15_10955 [Bacteroidia bacterium]|nr:hypothetical protein [Bacteroidia bacterium]
MRFLIAALIFFALSCGNNNVPEQEHVFVLSGKKSLVPDSAKQRLLRILEGGWVNEDYISALDDLHSPVKAASAGLPERQMAFDISHVNGDTLVNGRGRMDYDATERFDIVFFMKRDSTVGFRIGENPGYNDEQYALNYSFENNDTILLLTVSGEKTVTYRFRRVFRAFPESDNVTITAIEYFINETLFNGKWKSSDGKETEFLPDGRVKNFKGYKRYSVYCEKENAVSRPDEISFYNDTSGVTYAYTLIDNVLKFYELKESDDGMEISRGKLVTSMEMVKAE